MGVNPGFEVWMHFLIGLGLVIFGLWMLAKWGAAPLESPTRPCETKTIRELELQVKIEELKLKLVDLRLEHHRELESRCDRSELEEMVLQDALNREKRAKVVLASIMQEIGYKQADIEKVLSMVDGEEIS